MQKVKDIYRALVNNEHVMRVVHTFWQTFLAVFLIGLPVILSALKAHGVSEAEKALLSLVSASAAAGFAAVKALIVSKG
jgi:hypothetical protein